MQATDEVKAYCLFVGEVIWIIWGDTLRRFHF